MKKRIFRNKKNIKFVIAFIFGLIVTLVIGYSTGTPEFDSIFVLYNNTNSQMTSNTVQAAIDELNTKCGRCPVGKECFNYTDYEGNDFYQKFAINGYKKLTFVDVFMGTTFYIDTGVAAADDVGIYINFQEQTENGGSYIFGTSGFVQTRGTTVSWPNTIHNKKFYWNGSVIYQIDSNNEIDDQQMEIFANYKNSRYVEVNHVRTDIPAALNSKYTGNMFIFNKNDGSGNTSGQSANIRLYDFVVTKGSSIVKKYTPCMNSSNQVGLCEEVTGTFNSGGTSLNAGPFADERASDRFKVGDYVQMKSRWYCDEASLPASMTGHSSAQTLCNTHTKTHTWRVISINPDRTVDMVMADTTDAISIHGVTGYKNFIDTLNYAAGFYANPYYTKKARAMGYADVDVMDSRKLYQVPILATPTTSTNTWYNNGECFCTGNNNIWNEIEQGSNYTYLKTYVDDGFGDYGYRKDYTTVKNALGTNDASNDYTYFLASRYHGGTSIANQCTYSILAHVSTWNSPGWYSPITETRTPSISEDTGTAAIRPILTLYTFAIPLSGTGTSADPYIIN